MYFLPNGIWKSKDFSPLAQFSILKEDTLAVFSAYNPVICNDLVNISIWLSQHQFKFTSSIIFLPTLLFLLLPIPVIMIPFTKQRILNSLNFVAFFLTVCLNMHSFIPQVFLCVLPLGQPPCWVLKAHNSKKADQIMPLYGAYSLGGKIDSEHIITNVMLI